MQKRGSTFKERRREVSDTMNSLRRRLKELETEDQAKALRMFMVDLEFVLILGQEVDMAWIEDTFGRIIEHLKTGGTE